MLGLEVKKQNKIKPSAPVPLVGLCMAWPHLSPWAWLIRLYWGRLREGCFELLSLQYLCIYLWPWQILVTSRGVMAAAKAVYNSLCMAWNLGVKSPLRQPFGILCVSIYHWLANRNKDLISYSVSFSRNSSIWNSVFSTFLKIQKH